MSELLNNWVAVIVAAIAGIVLVTTALIGNFLLAPEVFVQGKTDRLRVRDACRSAEVSDKYTSDIICSRFFSCCLTWKRLLISVGRYFSRVGTGRLLRDGAVHRDSRRRPGLRLAEGGPTMAMMGPQQRLNGRGQWNAPRVPDEEHHG